MARKATQFRFELVSGAIALVTAALVVAVLYAGRNLLYTELQWHFEKSALLSGNINQVLMLSKYENRFRLLHDSISQDQADANEYRLGRALGYDKPRIDTTAFTNDMFTKASAYGIDQMRRILGKPPLPDQQDIATTQRLFEAFQLEYRYRYTDALASYERLLATSTDPVLIGTIRLHMGFCSAMLEQKQNARSHYLWVMEHHRMDDLGHAAFQLLSHMDRLDNERKQLQNAALPALAKARRYVQLMQCREALRILDTLQLDSASEPERLILRGRCDEEAGNTQLAANHYLQAITQANYSPAAREANRRLFMVSSKSKDSVALRATAVHLNNSLQDTALEAMHSEAPPPMPPGPPPPLPPELAHLQQQAQQVISTPVTIVEEAPPPPPERPQFRPDRQPPPKPLADNKGLVQGEKSRVKLNNGKEFSGTVISGPGENIVRIQTMIGVIGIPRDQIDTALGPPPTTSRK